MKDETEEPAMCMEVLQGKIFCEYLNGRLWRVINRFALTKGD